MSEQLRNQAEIREIVRERYAAAARGARAGASCCGDGVEDSCGGGVFGDALYGSEMLRARLARPSRHRSAAACRRQSPTCTRARPCSISARAPGRTC